MIFACEGRDQSAVERFVADLHAHGGSARNITDACTDLSKAYIAGVAKHLPGATLSLRFAGDRFRLSGEWGVVVLESAAPIVRFVDT